MLTTVEWVEREIRKTTSGTQEAVDQQALLDAIDDVVGQLEEDTLMNREFIPRIETRYWDALPMSEGGQIKGQTLHLADDLISLTSLVNDGTPVDASDYTLLPRGDRVIQQIKLANGALWPYTATTIEGSIAIAGEWGWVERPSIRWKSTGDTVQQTITASGTVVQVADINGVGWRRDAPRFSPAQLLKIDSEFLQVRAVNAATSPDELTILRGVNGSTPAIHTATTAIETWNMLALAERYATRGATLQYRRRGSTEKKTVRGMTEIVYPSLQTLDEYRGLLKKRRAQVPVMG